MDEILTSANFFQSFCITQTHFKGNCYSEKPVILKYTKYLNHELSCLFLTITYRLIYQPAAYGAFQTTHSCKRDFFVPLIFLLDLVCVQLLKS